MNMIDLLKRSERRPSFDSVFILSCAEHRKQLCLCTNLHMISSGNFTRPLSMVSTQAGIAFVLLTSPVLTAHKSVIALMIQLDWKLRWMDRR